MVIFYAFFSAIVTFDLPTLFFTIQLNVFLALILLEYENSLLFSALLVFFLIQAHLVFFVEYVAFLQAFFGAKSAEFSIERAALSFPDFQALVFLRIPL